MCKFQVCSTTVSLPTLELHPFQIVFGFDISQQAGSLRKNPRNTQAPSGVLPSLLMRTKYIQKLFALIYSSYPRLSIIQLPPTLVLIDERFTVVPNYIFLPSSTLPNHILPDIACVIVDFTTPTPVMQHVGRDISLMFIFSTVLLHALN